MPAREALKLGAEEGWEGTLGLLSLCLGPPGPQFRVAAAGLVSRNPTQGPAPYSDSCSCTQGQSSKP